MSLKKITNDTNVTPGPRLFLVSGYSAEELVQLGAFLGEIGYDGVPVKYCTLEQLDDTVASVLESPPGGEAAGNGKLPTVMVLSGMTSQDVQLVMGRFKDCDLPRPIFATTTPTNMGFTVKTLLRHLREEQLAAIGGRKISRKPAGKRKKKPKSKPKGKR